MTESLRLVIFDCDGTLVDSQHGIIAAMEDAMTRHGWPAPTPAQTRAVVGLSLEEAIERLLLAQGAAPQTVDPHPIAESYKQAFSALRQQPDHDEPLFPGTLELLDALDEAGVLYGIATGKSRRGLISTLKHHDLAERFVTLQTVDDAAGKPHPEMVLRALSAVGVDRAASVVVGDTSFDMLMARNAGVPGVGVSWGYHAPEELTAHGAQAVLDHFDELMPLLPGLWGREPAA